MPREAEHDDAAWHGDCSTAACGDPCVVEVLVESDANSMAGSGDACVDQGVGGGTIRGWWHAIDVGGIHIRLSQVGFGEHRDEDVEVEEIMDDEGEVLDGCALKVPGEEAGEAYGRKGGTGGGLHS